MRYRTSPLARVAKPKPDLVIRIRALAFGGLLGLTALGSFCPDLPPPPTGTAPPSLLPGMQLAPASTFADGASRTSVSVSIRGDAGFPATVTFSTNAGLFLPSGTQTAVVTPDATTGLATAILQAPRDSGMLLVSATLGTTVVWDTIPIQRAYPQFLAMVSDSLSISDTMGVRKLTVTVTRYPGVVTRGTTVLFHAAATDTTGAAGGPVGTLTSQTTTDSTGTAIGYFSLAGDDGAHSGIATITASVVPISGAPLSTQLALPIVPALAPAITLSANPVLLSSTVGDTAAILDTVMITNGGTGSLSGLSLGPITYSGPGVGWLRAAFVSSVSTSSAAGAIVLAARPGLLTPGTDTALVTIEATSSRAKPQTLLVVFTVP